MSDDIQATGNIGNSGFAATSIPNVYLSTSPAIAAFDKKLYLVHKGGGTNTHIYWTYFDGNQWAPEQIIPGSAVTESCALAAYQNKLYLAHKGAGTNSNLYWNSFDGNSWSGEQIIPNGAASSESPALAEFNGKLYVAHKGQGTNPNIYYASFDGNGWSWESMLPNANMTGTPALAVYDQQLFLIHQGSNGNGELWYSRTYNAENWAPDTQVPNVVMYGSPAATVFNGKLYVAHQGSPRTQSVEYLWYVTFDGTNWSSDANMGAAGLMMRESSPALSMYNGQLFWAITGRDQSMNYQISPYGRIETFVAILDVWGEGRRVEPGLVTGFYGVQNLNKIGQQQGTGPMPIPSLVPVDSYGPPSDQKPLVFPIANNNVGTITIMGSPIFPDTAKEMRRVLAPGGKVLLYGYDPSYGPDAASIKNWEDNMGSLRYVPGYEPVGIWAEPTLRPVRAYVSD